MGLLDVGVRALPTTVYVASAWWRDSDPFVCVVAIESEDAEQKVREAVDEAADEAFQNSEPEDDRTKEDYLDEIAWSGVFAESRSNLTLSQEKLDDLNRDGYAYLDTP